MSYRQDSSIESNNLIRYYCFNKLVRLQYNKYYRYSLLINKILLKRFYFHFFRVFIQCWPYHFIINPYFKFIKQIYLRDTDFYKNISGPDVFKNIAINIRKLNLNPYKQINSESFKKKLYGGSNHIVVPTNHKNNTFSYDKTQKFFDPLKNAAFFKGFVKFDNFDLTKLNILFTNIFFEMFLNILLEIYRFKYLILLI